jgi:RNase H-like domain found in reverse transcriptase/Reverse transcriptase (RNA-dependent DNA polymerase)
MFFGLTNSPATFQMMMNAIFAEEIAMGWLSIYMDDMLITTKNDLPLHRKYVHHVLNKLAQHDLYLKPEKCVFEQSRIEFLGVVLEHNTVHMDPVKVKGVADWTPPRNVTEVRAFLGFTGFYRYFIPNYSNVARPLIDLTKKTQSWTWGPAQFQAFETLKTLMCRQPVLTQPDYDKQFTLQTNASAYGVGAILSQEGDSQPNNLKPKLHPVTYYSASLTPAVMDLPRSTGQATSPSPRTHTSSWSTPIPIPKHACMHWAFCKKSGCKWHA